MRYRVSDDKIAVHLAGSAPPNVVQGQSLAAHQVAQIATEADRLCYFRNNVASHVPHLLLQRLLHDTQIRENRVPGSTAVYEITAGQSFLIINIYLQMYLRNNEMAVYSFHPLPFAAIDNQIFLSYKASEIKIDIPDFTPDLHVDVSSDYTCHMNLMTEVISPIAGTCDRIEHKLPMAEEIFPQFNGSFLVSKAGLLHAICANQPPITRKFEYHIQLLFIPKSCRVNILYNKGYNNGLSYSHEQKDNHSYSSLTPVIVLQYNVEFHATHLDKLHLRSVINSSLFILLCLVMAIAIFSVYRFVAIHRMRLVTGRQQSAIEFYSREAEREDTPELPVLCLEERGGNPFLQNTPPLDNEPRQERPPASPRALHCAVESAVHAAELCIDDSGRRGSTLSVQSVAWSGRRDEADTENNFITSCKHPHQLGTMRPVSSVRIWPPASHSTV